MSGAGGVNIEIRGKREDGGQVSEQLRHLDGTVKRLIDVTNRVRIALEPVSIQRGEPDPEKKQPTPVLCPLAERIREQVNQIDQQIMGLESQLRTLEL